MKSKTILSEEDRRYVVDNWDTKSATGIARELGLGRSIILSVVKEIGLESKSDIFQNKTDKIDHYLLEHYGEDESFSEIALKLKEKDWLIMDRARTLGLELRNKDIIGTKIGKLYVESRIPEIKKYKCICDCGEIRYADPHYLRDSKCPSCIKCRKQPKAWIWKDMIGKRFGRLTVLKESLNKNKWQTADWVCQCDCGVIKTIAGAPLRNGATMSCGCLQKDMLSGPNSRFWKGGVTSVYRKLRSSRPYIKWSKQIRARDNHTCQCCGYRSLGKKELVAHHVLSFSNNHNLRLDMNNGITLCNECHDGFMISAKWGTILPNRSYSLLCSSGTTLGVLQGSFPTYQLLGKYSIKNIKIVLDFYDKF